MTRNHTALSSSGPARRPAAKTLAALFALFVFAPAALAQAPAAQETGSTFKLKSEVLGEERTILVRTPPGYDGNTHRYPVLYMTDGDAHIQHTGATVGFLARNGRMPEMIVVGISNTDRTRDLTPTKVERMPGNPNARFPTSGGADKFLKFIETELIPHVESKYRTVPFRALAGHSLGGMFALHAMATRPDTFNAFIAVSPSLQWDNFVTVDRVKEFFKTRKDYNRTLFITLGNEQGDIEDGFKLLQDVLAKQQANGFAWEAAHLKDEDHGSVVLRSHYAGLRKIYDGWQFPRDPMTGAMNVTSLKGLEDHFAKLSERLSYKIIAPEPLMNQFGYQLLGASKFDEAIEAFKLNVERYPNSANVYDSLAEGYERGGKLDLALPNYEKAVAVGKRTADPNLNVFQTNFNRVSELLAKSTSAEKKQ